MPNPNAQKLIDAVNKKYGDNTMMRAADVPTYPPVHSGSYSLDYAIGIGGFPSNRVIEVGGAEGCGKTTLGLLSLRESLLYFPDRFAVILDMEHKLEMDWVRQNVGDDLMDSGRVLYLQPDHIEQATNIYVDLVSTGDVCFVLYDSIGGSVSMAVATKEAEKVQVGGAAQAIGKFMKLAAIHSSKYRCCTFATNQEREDMSGYMRYITPGGKGAKHSFIIRVRLRASTKGEDKVVRKIGTEDVQVGNKIVATVVKNQVAAPYRTAQWNFFNVWTEEFGFGIDATEEVVRLGVAVGVIQGSGWYTHPAFPADAKGDRKINGIKAVQAAVKADETLKKTIVSETMAALKGNDDLLAAVAPIDREAAESEENQE